MFLEFLHDRTTHHLDNQYMLGPALLVAPVFTPSEDEYEYYIPAGRWTYFWSEGTRTVNGPVWLKERVPIDEIPLWIRPGSVLCLGPKGTGRPDYDFGKDIEVQLYHIPDNQSVLQDIPANSGTEAQGKVKVERKNGSITFEVVEGTCSVNTLKIVDTSVNIGDVTGGIKASAVGNDVTEIKLNAGSSKVVCQLV
jgi:alpha-glucosidase (family GH31 glycosyl hydrolase)